MDTLGAKDGPIRELVDAAGHGVAFAGPDAAGPSDRDLEADDVDGVS